MTVAVMRTKAESALIDAFQGVVGRLPGGAQVAKARAAALQHFAEAGLPHRRVEEWKYTDLRNLLKDALPLSVDDRTKVTTGDLFVALGPFACLELPRVLIVNGAWRKELSSAHEWGGEVGSLADALAKGATLSDASGDAVLALNTAYATDGVMVRVPAGVTLAKPLLVLNVQMGPEARSTVVRNHIEVGANAKATIIEAFVTLPGANPEGQLNAATEVVAADHAEVTHIKLAAQQPKVTHLVNWLLTLGEGTTYRGFQMTVGVAVARNQIRATYKGQHARLDLSGLLLGRGHNHMDTTLVVDHAVPHCESRELFKAVLDDRARAVFQGKVIVREGAQKSDGKQMAQALMLSPDAEFDSKPELEIYADDVVCGHGSTVAELDEDLLFYCMSRGIPKAEARAMLVESFIGEALDKVADEGVREALAAVAAEWLAGAPPKAAEAA